MYRRVLRIVTPVALLGLAACGVDDADMSVEDAVYMSALEDEEMGSEEGEEPTNVEPVSEEADPCSLEAIRGRVMHRFDGNRNGHIDGDEQGNMSRHFGGDEEGEVSQGERGERGRHHGHRGHGHHKLKRIKWIYDVDASGDLSEDERAVLESDLVARCENKTAYLLENFDADEDGELSEEERDAARDARRAARAERRAEKFAAIDTDGDGEISQEEKEAAREARGDRRDEKRAAILEAFDADGDGELSEDEKNDLRDYLREWVRGEHMGEGRPF